MSASRTGTERLPKSLPWYVASMIAAAVLGVALAFVRVVTGPPPTAWWLIALDAGLFTIASLRWIGVRVGSDRINVVFSEMAVAACLVLLPTGWVVLTVAVGAIGLAASERRPLAKSAFNAAMHAVGAWLATLVAGVVAGGSVIGAHSARQIVAILAGSLIFGIWTDLAVSVAIALSAGGSALRVYRAGMGAQAVGGAGNVLAAAVLLLVVRIDPRLLILVPALLLFLRQLYQARLRSREERASWQQLLEATRVLADLDERVVLTAAATTAATLFSADFVEVETAGGRLVRGTDRDASYDGPAAAAPPRVAQTVIERSLGPDAAPLGVLRLCFRGRVTLRDRERAMLGALAAELHSALVNAAQHAKAWHAASHDPLTGLLNRAGLLAEGAPAIVTAVAGGVDVALLLIDLTGFREIVDTLGHAAGDTVLTHTASRLSAAAIPGELVARLDGDDYAVLLPRLTDPVQASHRAETLLGALSTPAEIGGTSLSVTGVAGIAYSFRGRNQLDDLLRQAGVAVHALRSDGRRIDFYAPEKDAASVSRLVLASELRSALTEAGQFELLYQPILDLASGEAIAAEALVRWNHPTRGPVDGEEFLPVVEHAGLLPELTKQVLDLALGAAADWERHGILVPVAINVSPRTLLDREFPGQVAAALSRRRVPAARLTLEITETSVLSHLEVVDQVLDELRDLGVRLSLAGFGTGWSSLSHLARVPVHEVKLAGSFTESLLSTPQAAAIVRGTLEIARALDLRVVAEGVASPMQRSVLLALGCQAGQGSHFFPPLTTERIGPALWSSTVRAMAVSEGADVIPMAQHRAPRA